MATPSGAPGGPSTTSTTSTTEKKSGSEVMVAIRVDYPSATHVCALDASRPLSDFIVGASRLLRIDRDVLARYAVRAVRLGVDAIDLTDDETNSKTPLGELGIGNGWSLVFGAPADARPARRKRVKPGEEKDEKSSSGSDAKFAGLTPTNCLTKLRTAKGKTQKTILEYIDKYWGQIYKTAKKDLMSQPPTVLIEIFKSDGLNAKELDVWQFALAWAKEENKRKKITDSPETLRTAIGPLLPHVRLPCLNASDMAGHVAPTGILLPDQLLALFSHIATQAAKKGSSSSSTSSKEKKLPGSAGPKVSGFLATPRKGTGVSFTLDPSRKGSIITLSNENMTLTGGSSHQAGIVLGTQAISEGQHYWEVKVDKGRTGGHVFVGLALEGMSLETYLGGTGGHQSFGWYHTSGYSVPGSLATNPSGTFTFTNGDTIGFFLDCDRRILQMYINKSYRGQVTLQFPNTYYPAFGCYGQEDQLTLVDNPTMPDTMP